jgi:undecaprenyl-diphosphatase
MEHGLRTPLSRSTDATARFGLRTMLLALAILLVALPFGFLLEQVTTAGRATSWDSSAAQGLNDRLHGHGSVIAAMETISFTGKPVFLFVVIGSACVWLLRNGATRLVTFLIVTCLGGGLLDTIVKEVVARPRPVVAHPIIHAFGKSFPSGHSMQGVVAYGALLVVFAPLLMGAKRLAALTAYVTWAVTIGFSRLALGVHYITDVLGGFVLGAAWLCGMVAVFQTWRVERGRPKTDVLQEGVEPEEAEDLVASTP